MFDFIKLQEKDVFLTLKNLIFFRTSYFNGC